MQAPNLPVEKLQLSLCASRMPVIVLPGHRPWWIDASTETLSETSESSEFVPANVVASDRQTTRRKMARRYHHPAEVHREEEKRIDQVSRSCRTT
jgi:hypothetical protein